MEVLKKKILQVLTTGTTATTGGTRYIIIPDLTVTYSMKIGIASVVKDIGFFDSYTGTTNTYSPSQVYSKISGSTLNSRLAELEKYVVTSVFANKYYTNGSFTVDGIDVVNSNPLEQIVYYIGGIKYTDVISAMTTGVTSGTTYMVYTPLGTGNTNNFTYSNYYKNPSKENIISNPKIDDDVFITRQEVSAFDKMYKLEFIENLNDLITYAGGNYFKIINNI